MSDSGFHRPRRSFAHDTDSEKPIADDDTPVSASSAARRGLDPEATDPPHDAGPEVPRPINPFARPGSESAAREVPTSSPMVPAPAPMMPGRDSQNPQSAGDGRGSAPAPGLEPHRSAGSSTSPAESRADDGGTPSAPSQSWLRHHRKSLLLFVAGALVLALFVTLGAFWLGRDGQPTPPPPATSTSPSPSPSESLEPAVSVDSLMTVEDAEAVVAGATWTIASTAETRQEAEARPACLGGEITTVNPTDSLQRAIGTSGGDMLAALHQVDLYASEEAAQQVQSERATALTACDEVPALIVGASTITGIGDEAMQMRIAFQGDPVEGASEVMHTVLLVRTGRALTMLDVTRNDDAIPTEDAIAGLVGPLNDICDRVDGTCPTDPVANPILPPPVEPFGWLITSDLPRIRPGFGQWVAREEQPVIITSQGMGCENMTLATEPGPTERQQRTYLLTQDEETPTTFGMDEMVFDFEDNAAARVFSNRLIDSLLSCGDRNATAEVTDLGAVNGGGADGVDVSARLITIDQATSDDSAVRYQLVVAIADSRVSYLLTSVTDDYQFTPDQLSEVALRMAHRLSQG